MAKGVSAADLSDQPTRMRFTMRGRLYRFVEIDGAKYDEFLALARSVESDGTETINNKMMSQLLLSATCVEPKKTAAEWAKTPFGLLNSLTAVVNKLYYEIEQPKVTEDNETDDDKGEG